VYTKEVSHSGLLNDCLSNLFIIFKSIQVKPSLILSLRALLNPGGAFFIAETKQALIDLVLGGRSIAKYFRISR
jgi:hypothetical protein